MIRSLIPYILTMLFYLVFHCLSYVLKHFEDFDIPDEVYELIEAVVHGMQVIKDSFGGVHGNSDF